jgi:hypothetical protein
VAAGGINATDEASLDVLFGEAVAEASAAFWRRARLPSASSPPRASSGPDRR